MNNASISFTLYPAATLLPATTDDVPSPAHFVVDQVYVRSFPSLLSCQPLFLLSKKTFAQPISTFYTFVVGFTSFCCSAICSIVTAKLTDLPFLLLLVVRFSFSSSSFLVIDIWLRHVSLIVGSVTGKTFGGALRVS